MYLTLFYGVIDPVAGTLVYSNAGHPHAFVVREDGSAERLAATDPAVGFAGPDSYHEVRVAWHSPHDLMLLFTDGLPDSLRRDKGARSAEELVVRTAARHRARPTPEIIEALFALSGQQDQTSPLGDDRTALVLRR